MSPQLEDGKEFAVIFTRDATAISDYESKNYAKNILDAFFRKDFTKAFVSNNLVIIWLQYFLLTSHQSIANKIQFFIAKKDDLTPSNGVTYVDIGFDTSGSFDDYPPYEGFGELDAALSALVNASTYNYQQKKNSKGVA